MSSARPKIPILALALLFSLTGTQAAHPAELAISEGTSFSVTAAPGGERLVIDLYDRLWELDRAGGIARALTGRDMRFRRPQIGPTADMVIAEGDTGAGQGIWLIDAGGESKQLTEGPGTDASPKWHPRGDRIVFSSDRDGSWDLYELWLADGSLLRITDTIGQELEPAISADGTLLAWIAHGETDWVLWVRREGLPARPVYRARHPLSAPAIRPDNGVVLLVEQAPSGTRLAAVILSDPAVTKVIAEGEDYFLHPAVWLDRVRYLYTADGAIRMRRFGESRWREIPFTAWISPVGPTGTEFGLDGAAPLLHHGRYVVRPGRVFDSQRSVYRRDLDILVEDDRIGQLIERRSWSNIPVLEYPDAVALPGLIQLGADPEQSPADGRRLLACGVTTLIGIPAGLGGSTFVDPGWNEGSEPGPNVILSRAPDGGLLDVSAIDEQHVRLAVIEQGRANGATIITDRLYPDLEAGASLLAAGANLPISPSGRQYADVTKLLEASGARWLDGGTPAGGTESGARHGRHSHGEASACTAHDRLRRLRQGGTRPAEALQRLTRDTARLVGLDSQRGKLAPGYRADLLLVQGNPLENPDDPLSLEAVIAGGRFFTPAGLLAPTEEKLSENLTKMEDSEEMSPNSDTFYIRYRYGAW